nr:MULTISPECIES: DUF3565 domain-containing protein [Pseudomonas]
MNKMNERSSVRGNRPDCDPPPSKQTSVILDFYQDEEGHWVVLLNCGHSQHLRHDPPWQTRTWVTDEAQRLKHIGQSFPCGWCAKS